MNTYLLVSETNYFIEQKLKELKDGIDNIVTFNMDVNTMNEVLEEASYLSMFNDKKCIIVKNAKCFSASRSGDTNKSKEDINKLMKYLERENPNTILIFISKTNADSKKKIVNILKEHNNLFVYPSISKTDMKNELLKIINQKGYKIEDRSLWHIINNSLGNFDLCVNELNKIITYNDEDKIIKYEDVLALTAKTIEENNFKLVDSMIARDLSSSLKYLDELVIFKVDPSVILALLYREFKMMLTTLIYEKNHYSRSDLLRTLKIADWQYQKIQNNLRNYREKEIKEEILKLADIDYKYKSGQIDKDTILINYILDLCI